MSTPKLVTNPNTSGAMHAFSGKTSLALALTNAHIHHFPKPEGVPGKIEFYLIQEPGKKPFFYINYHAASGLATARQSELQFIHQQVALYRLEVHQKYGILVDDYVLSCDSNDNLIKVGADGINPYIIDPEAGQRLFDTSYVFRNLRQCYAKIKKVMLPTGLMGKARGAQDLASLEEEKRKNIIASQAEKAKVEVAKVEEAKVAEVKVAEGTGDKAKVTSAKKGIQALKENMTDKEFFDAVINLNRTTEEKEKDPFLAFKNRAYDMFLNAQVEKHRKYEDADSKALVLHFVFEGPSISEEGALTHNQKMIADLLKEVNKTGMKRLDFLDDETYCQDHLPSKKEKIDSLGVTFQSQGGLPTLGPKAVKSAEGIFTPEMEQQPELRSELQIKATVKLFYLFYKHLGLLTPERAPPDLETTQGVEDAMKLMQDRAIELGYCYEDSKKSLSDVLNKCLDEMLGSQELINVLEMTQPDTKEKITQKLKDLRCKQGEDKQAAGSLLDTSAIKDFCKGKRNDKEAKIERKNPFQKFIQQFSQETGFSVCTGYTRINGNDLIGFKAVDDANMNSLLESYNESKNQPVLISSTESSEKEKSPYFTVSMELKGWEPLLKEWDELLDQYLAERKAERIYKTKDFITQAFEDRQRDVGELKALVLAFRSSPVEALTYGNTEKDDVAIERSNNLIATNKRNLLSKIKFLQQSVHGVKFAACLNQMEYQFNAYENTQQRLAAKEQKGAPEQKHNLLGDLNKAFFLRPTEFNERYTIEVENSYQIIPLASERYLEDCYNEINRLFKRAANLEGDRKIACEQVAYEATCALNEFCQTLKASDGKVSKEKAQTFEKQFSTILHSQDRVMSYIRLNVTACLRAFAEGVVGFFTLGTVPLATAAYTKLFEKSTSFSLFSIKHPTARCSQVANIERSLESGISRLVK